jgi:anti-anti-sigma factor
MTDVILIEAGTAYTHVAVQGPLDQVGVGEADLKLTSQLVPRQRSAIVDLSGVGIITSLGIGMLVAIARSLRARGVGMAVIADPSPVRHVLEISTLSPLIHVVGSKGDAIKALGLS